jgi:hypothetical protein
MSVMRVQVQGIRISGWKAVLAGIVALAVGGLIALLSLAALAVGVVVSAVAVLALRFRGALGWGKKPEPVVFELAPTSREALEVREIQVDEVVVLKERE